MPGTGRARERMGSLVPLGVHVRNWPVVGQQHRTQGVRIHSYHPEGHQGQPGTGMDRAVRRVPEEGRSRRIAAVEAAEVVEAAERRGSR